MARGIDPRSERRQKWIRIVAIALILLMLAPVIAIVAFGGGGSATPGL